jgi:muramidase (phage lysozyme)
LTVVTKKVLDWWNSWRMPTFNLWGMPATADQGGTKPATPVKINVEMIKRVDALLVFAREQTEYQYTEGTAGVLAAMGKGTFKHEKGEKESNKPLGLCYTYVKVALTRSKIIDGILAAQKTNANQTDEEHFAMQESASKAGPALIAKGFRDVSADVPDARWAAAGDVIVYEWSDATWENRKKRKKNPKIPNYGHIDIRDYDFYISDFIPKAKHPSWASYVNIRIYRKDYDALPTQRIRAFLHCLREFECQQEHDESKRYQMLNFPPPGMSGKYFSDFSTHPWKNFPPPPDPYSTASGAYQILRDTWKEKFDQELIEPKGARFSPAIQDRIAVMKLEDRGVLHLVRTGKVQEALEFKTPKGVLSLPSEWSSLPGGRENKGRKTADNKPMDMAYFISLFDKYLEEERKKG